MRALLGAGRRRGLGRLGAERLVLGASTAAAGVVNLTAYDVDRADREPVSGACLVGGIVHAAGGPRAVRSQLVQRTLDLTWHVLREDERTPVRWCPAPPVRAAHVRDLTRWNDHPRRTVADVRALLERAVHTADLQIAACRATAP